MSYAMHMTHLVGWITRTHVIFLLRVETMFGAKICAHINPGAQTL